MAQDPKTGLKDIYQHQFSNYPLIVNELIQKSLDARVNKRQDYPLFVDSIEISIAFAIGIDKEYPKELKALDTKITKIHKTFKENIDGVKEKDQGPHIRTRDKALLEIYDAKIKHLIIKYNEWVQLFKKPIKRSISTIWTAP